jgi:4-amino-4-deoxy-L-arabinose transferase-like glycosyltransferase
MTMMSSTSSPRREAIAIALFTAIGAALRLWQTWSLGLVHFDEGIYAQAGMWVWSSKGISGIDPQVMYYAPPGFPILVGFAYLIGGGPSDVAAILVSQLAGIATIPVIGWLGRRAFGPGAGAAAAGLAAVAGPHVAFSRMALTDATFLLAWLVAIGLGGRFLERPTLLRSACLGVAVGGAQNVKYNGFLAGFAVLVAWLSIGAMPGEGRRPGLVRTLVLGAIAAGIALATYWPWVAFVESHGGYSGLVAHHRGYLTATTPRAWIDHWWTQMAEQTALSGFLFGYNWGAIGWALAWLGCGLAVNGTRLSRQGSRWDAMWFRIGLIAGIGALGAVASVPWWVSLAASPWILAGGSASARVIAASWLTFAVLTPFYHPYARLWLPLHAASWLILGGQIAQLGPFRARASAITPTGPDSSPPARPRPSARVVLLGVCVAVAFGLELGPSRRPYPMIGLLESSDSTREACTTLLATLQRYNDVQPIRELRVLARPSVLFYLSTRGSIPIRSVPDAESLYRPAGRDVWALVDYGLEPQPPLSARAEEWASKRWDLVESGASMPNVPTLLDHHPEAARPSPGSPLQVQTGSSLLLFRPLP